MCVTEGCWLQKTELMKAGSVLWQVPHLVFVRWEPKQVDFALLEISFKFPACLLRSRFLNTVISSMFHRCSVLARNCSIESWICRWGGTHRDGISMTLICANSLRLDPSLRHHFFSYLEALGAIPLLSQNVAFRNNTGGRSTMAAHS